MNALARRAWYLGWATSRVLSVDTVCPGCGDARSTLVGGLASDGVQAVVRRTARFNWHRDLIVRLARQRGLAALLFRARLR